ncbi:hypothetical protein V5H41_28365 [Salmonella enterica]
MLFHGLASPPIPARLSLSSMSWAIRCRQCAEYRGSHRRAIGL